MSSERFFNERKRHLQAITDELRQKIVEGELRPNDFLLPERELAAQYGVGLRVIRESLATLSSEGLIARRQGRGTVVLPKGHTKQAAGAGRKNIAVIFLQRIRDTSTLEFFDLLQQTFQRSGYSTTVLVSDEDPQKEADIVDQLVRDGITGIILFTAHPSDSFEHLARAQAAGVKVALFDHYFPQFQTNFVGIDDRLAAYEATVHLIQLGCEELMLITAEKDWTTHTLRQSGFQDALGKVAPHLPYQVLKVPSFDGVDAFLEASLPSYLPEKKRKLGVIVWNDLAALSTITNLQKMGWSIPEDAAVVGFADDLDAAIAPIPLTTIQIPRQEIAQLCAYSLLQQIENPSCPYQEIKVPARLIIRESCGCYLQRKNVPERTVPRSSRV